MSNDPAVRRQMATAFTRVVTQLRSESDRGSVVLALCWIDDELTRTLQAFCAPISGKTSKSDELFDSGRPVGTASAKIDLARRLGLLNDRTHRSLHLIRRLRNDFAHLTDALDFASQRVQDRVRVIFELQQDILDAIWSDVRDDDRIRSEASLHGIQSSAALHSILGTRGLFDLCVGTVVAGLVLTTSSVEPVSKPADTD